MGTDVDTIKELSRDGILNLQESMLPIRCMMPEAEHFFAPGVYGRKFVMPAGMVVVGKTHKHQHLMMVLKGHAKVVTESGVEEVRGGHVSVSQEGAKRVVYAIEETVFMTVHHNPTDTMNLESIEKDHIIDEGFKNEYHLPNEGGKTCLK